MNNERIVFTNPDGSCGVLIPTGEISIEAVMAKDVPAGASNARQITTAELPQDRLFRGAWDDSNPESFIGTNLVKAKLIAHRMRRIDREAKLAPLDKEESFAKTSQGRKDAILAEKTSILDDSATMQADIDLASNESILRTTLINAGIFQ